MILATWGAGALKKIPIISTALMTPTAHHLSGVCLPAELQTGVMTVKKGYCTISIMLGPGPGLIIGFVTECYTSCSYVPGRIYCKPC